MTTTVHLGYEVGTGTPVAIPLKHMAVCGQTQESGKTTTLEALIRRSGLRAVTFITKRGEASFTDAHRTQPYFKDQGGWQYVASVLEASRGEKLKFERAWIIRASQGANTLAEVQANVKKALADPKIRGMSADVYLTLNAYLEVVVPTIARIDWAPSLHLRAGVNAIDLTEIPEEMQHLVIKSTIDWVLHREQKTVIVVPEAWKYIPQGRGTPVKLGAEAYIRQGAALGNYLWLDSQDLGGIEKTILRSVAVWILGVQREANEIKRTLENLPASAPQLKAADIASLELGQFYACYARHAIKTYVQPTWLDGHKAAQVARGSIQTGVFHQPPAPTRPKEETVTKDEAKKLASENAELRATITELRMELKRLTTTQSTSAPPAPQSRSQERRFAQSAAVKSGPATETLATHDGQPLVEDQLYEAIKARLLADAEVQATLLKVQHRSSAIVVEVERRAVTIEGSSTRGRVARLVAQGWFDEARAASAVRGEMKRTGADPGGGGSLYDILNAFVRDGFLVRDGDKFAKAPSCVVTERELQAV